FEFALRQFRPLHGWRQSEPKQSFSRYFKHGRHSRACGNRNAFAMFSLCSGLPRFTATEGALTFFLIKR
ncbi:hypothetical protein, partial [Pedobacter sp. Leaf216]|uniref:hypothetical protein n=1 Tax=Pedobacter sp. Leaf216 TaxID=1735684 RepID=UPI001F429606